MKKAVLALAASLLLAAGICAQVQNEKPSENQAIRIGTQLVQLDAVVVDKNGKVVTGLSRDDFELYDSGKKQLISFFEFVDAGTSFRPGQPGVSGQPPERAAQGLGEADVRRIFAFVIDDLTIRGEDLFFVRQMLTNFVDNRMQSTDLVTIVRTVGGKGLLQAFTTDKDLLRRAIASLTVSTHPFSPFSNPDPPDVREFAAASAAPSGGGGNAGRGDAVDLTGSTVDVASPQDDTNKMLR